MNTEKLHPMKKCRGHRKKRRGTAYTCGRIFMPASFVQKWIIPTIRARNALNGHGKQLPGGYETAMLFSIFDQSILDLTKPRRETDDDDHALRAIIACAQDANSKLIERMRQGNNGLKEIAGNSLNQLEQAVRYHHIRNCGA